MLVTNEDIAHMLNEGADFLGEHELARGHYALDDYGHPADPKSTRAMSFCALGSVSAKGHHLHLVEQHILYLSQSVLGKTLVKFSDKAKNKREVQTAMRRVAYVAAIRSKNEKSS
jgi:hypothetical protein